MCCESTVISLKPGAGEYVDLKRDHCLQIHKHALGSASYKAVGMRFDRRFLCEYFRSLDETAFPQPGEAIPGGCHKDA